MAKLKSIHCRWIFLFPLLLSIFFLIACGKQATPAPKPQPPPPFEFAGSWGEKGEGPGKLNQPTAFAADELGNIFFADIAGSGFVHKFEANGTPLLSFEDGRVRRAAGIAVDSGGAIYVADAERGNMFIFFPDGSFLRALHFTPQRHFSGVLGISVDDQGDLYVPDPNGSRFVKFDARGRLSKIWVTPKKGAPEERPSAVAVAAAEDSSFYVAYFQTGRIEKYSPDGSLVTSWIAVDNSAGAPHPISGFAVKHGFVFTMAAASSQIRVWMLDGQHKLDADLGVNLGTTVIAAPQIAITPHSELLVFDPATPKVFRFRMHLDTKGQP